MPIHRKYVFGDGTTECGHYEYHDDHGNVVDVADVGNEASNTERELISQGYIIR